MAVVFSLLLRLSCKSLRIQTTQQKKVRKNGTGRDWVENTFGLESPYSFGKEGVWAGEPWDSYGFFWAGEPIEIS